MFQYVEVDGNLDTVELYVNTGFYQLPLIKKPKDFTEFLERIPKNPDVGAYMNKFIQSKEWKTIPKASLGVKLLDNQLEGYFEDVD